MQTFPLFLSLHGRRALLVGGTEAAARKAELLLSAGARVSLIADTVCGAIAQLIADGALSWAGHDFDDGDLAGVSLVIVASRDEALQARVSAVVQKRCLPINVVDRPRLSSFIMPAVVDRAPVTIAISTGGAAPALARRLRAEIERALPAALGRMARFADIFRDQVRRTLDESAARRRFWDRVFDGRVGELALAGDETGARRELIRLLAAERRAAAAAPGAAPGIVHVIGAGPGDPDLLTLKAHRLLQAADVLVYDPAVAPEIVARARREAERLRLPAGEAGGRLLELAAAGRSVVRLTAGDPREEARGLAEAGISVQVVPGVPYSGQEVRAGSWSRG